MKLESEHLEILAMIVEKGGLTEGAAALGKSQPSVSRTISLLEKRVGAPLFEPGRRPLRPTELGASLARLGGRIHALNGEAQLLVERFRKGQAGRLRLGGTPIFMDGVVAAMIAEFQQHHSDVHVEQSYGYLDAMLAQLRNGSLDMAILPLHPNQIPQDMEFTSLLPGRNVIACRVGHPLTRKSTITLADIDPFPWIAPPVDSPLYRDLQRALISIGSEDFRVNFSGGTFASIASVLAGSDSLTVLPYSVVFQTRKMTQIEALPLKIEHPDRQLGLLVRRDQASAPALTHFKAFMAQQCRQLEARIQHEQQVTRRRG
ncbi:MAG: LysR family transcriptional regulator [Rhodobacteraceae bacterium]|nr:LysR family transcriptional regulator [Paracoccaceae bacterium]